LQEPSRTAPFDVLRRDVSAHGTEFSEADWKALSEQWYEVTIEKRREVFANGTRHEGLLFVTHGICAAQFALPNGQMVISRFFEARDLCAVVEFTHMGLPIENSIVAVTPVEGVIIPKEFWKSEHLDGHVFGPYARRKMYKQHLFEIDILNVKTVNRTEVSYNFLRERHPTVLERVPQAMIAQFCGITPEGFSRFLRNHSAR